MKKNRPAPLYRKVNTRAHGVHHGQGPDYRGQRARVSRGESDGAMKQGAHRGRDYTPLYRFLLSRVGLPWGPTEREAQSRLDRAAPIAHLVLPEPSGPGYVRTHENSYFSALYVDETGVLRRVDASLGPQSLAPGCACCTHTFNGVPFTRSYVPQE